MGARYSHTRSVMETGKASLDVLASPNSLDMGVPASGGAPLVRNINNISKTFIIG